jgi:3-hydroxybutyryl-CoA dehydrogenase
MKNIKIGIIGAGTMGNGIAHVFSLFDFKVVLVDIDESVLDIAKTTILKNMNRQLKKEIIDNKKVKESINNILFSKNINNLDDCDLVIEAIKEDFDIKCKIFKELDLICKDSAILASNTSSISINKLSKETNRPDKVIGMHFMNPVPIMKLVEIIVGENTSTDSLNFIMDLSEGINKTPVKCNDSPGFVSNRILMPMINEAALCFEEGIATAESIDQIMMLGMSHPMGPLKLADLIGIDVCIYILNILYNDFNNSKYKPAEVLLTMKQNNKLGKKTGEGFYNYEF